MAFFTFHPNNSHGIFKGPHCIIIEAKDEAEALTIDEKGMAKDRAKKLEIAERIYGLVTEKYGIRASDYFV